MSVPKYVRTEGYPNYEVLEIQRYVPSDKPGYEKFSGQITIAEAGTAIDWFLKTRGFADGLEYFHIYAEQKVNREFPKYHHIAVFAVTGGNEGHYIHVEIIESDRRELVYLAKTLSESMDWCYEVCRELAKFLQA